MGQLSGLQVLLTFVAFASIHSMLLCLPLLCNAVAGDAVAVQACCHEVKQ